MIVRAARREGVSLKPSTSGFFASAAEGTPLLTPHPRAARRAPGDPDGRHLDLHAGPGRPPDRVDPVVIRRLRPGRLAIAAQALAGFASGTGERGAMAPLLAAP